MVVLRALIVMPPVLALAETAARFSAVTRRNLRMSSAPAARPRSNAAALTNKKSHSACDNHFHSRKQCRISHGTLVADCQLPCGKSHGSHSGAKLGRFLDSLGRSNPTVPPFPSTVRPPEDSQFQYATQARWPGCRLESDAIRRSANRLRFQYSSASNTVVADLSHSVMIQTLVPPSVR